MARCAIFREAQRIQDSPIGLWIGDKDHPETYLYKFAWSKIQRHVMVRSTASPDDPRLTDYWRERELRKIKTLPPKPRQLARRQNGRCPLCGESLFLGEPVEQHHIVRRDDGGKDVLDNLVLLHLYCHQQVTAAQQ